MTQSFRRWLGVAVLLAWVGSAWAADSSLTVEQLLAKHRASIGSEPALQAAKTRVGQGTARYEVHSGGAGSNEGKATLVSEGKQVRQIWRFDAPAYRGEDLLTNGDKVQIYKGFLSARNSNQPSRSDLGEFLWTQSVLLRDGLLGGTASTAWPLLDPGLRGAKLSYKGMKTIEGRPLHEVVFAAKKGSDAEIRLYFDPETFRHVLTVATMTVSPQMLSNTTTAGTIMDSAETASARQQTLQYRITQQFGGFQEFDGLTLPTESKIVFSVQGYSGSEVAYLIKFDSIQNNVTLDPKNFQIK